MAHQAEIGFTLDIAGRAFDVVRFELTEGVSQSFRLELDLSAADDAIDTSALLDRKAVFAIQRDGEAERTVIGVVTAFEQGETGFRLTRYKAVVESPLARLALRHNSRIFQQVDVPSILATLLDEHRLPVPRTSYQGYHAARPRGPWKYDLIQG